MFEIDKFESIKEQLIDKIDEEQIEIFRTYLQAKKEVIQEFHSLFFNFPTLLEKASDNLVNKFFYDFVINLPVEDSRFGKVHLTMPPKRNQESLIHTPAVFYEIKFAVENLLQTLNDSPWNKKINAVINCYKILNVNFKGLGAIPFKDLNISNALSVLFYYKPDIIELGFYSVLTPFLLQFKIFFDKLEVPFDTKYDAEFYELAIEFMEKVETISYNISENTYSIKPPCPKLFAIDLNSEEEVLKKSDYIKDLSIYFDLD